MPLVMHQKFDKQHMRNYAKTMSTENDQMLQAALDTSANALRSAFILNGTAAISMLAFIGNLIDSNRFLADLYAKSLVCFSMGALFVAMAAAVAYFYQYMAQHNPGTRSSHWMRGIGISLVFGSYAFFALGIFTAYSITTS